MTTPKEFVQLPSVQALIAEFREKRDGKPVPGVKVDAYYVTHDLFRAPSDHEDPTGWTEAPGYDGGVGSKRESPWSTEQHELRYRAYDDDDVLCAEGTTTMTIVETNGYGDEHEGAYLADRWHMADTGAVHTKFWDRKTGKALGEIFC